MRYDGYDFEIFNTDNGLPDNVVYQLFKDYKGRIWFVSYSGMLSYFENEKIWEYPYNKSLKKLTENSLIYNIYVDSLDGLHLGFVNKGYCHVFKDGKTRRDTITTAYQFNLMRIDNNYLLNRSHRDISTPLRIKITEANKELLLVMPPVDISNTSITKIFEVPENDMFYFCVEAHLFCYQKGKINLVYSGVENIISIYANATEVWIGLYNQGFLILDRTQNHTLISQDLTGLSISKIYTDKNGGMWFTTLEDGLFYSSNPNYYTLNKADGLPSDHVTIMEGFKDKLLIGDNTGNLTTFDHDLNKINTVQNSIKRFPKILKNKFTEEIIIDENSRTYNFEKPTVNWHINPFNHHLLFFIDSTRFLSLASINGKLNVLIIKPGTLLTYNLLSETLPLASISSGYKTQFNRMLITSKYGLFELFKSENDSSYFIKNLGNEHALFKTRMVEIADLDGFDFIAATRGEGVLFVKNNIPYPLKEKDGLLSNQITSIFVDSAQTVWVGTSNGLSIINPKKGIVNLRVEDGLISNEVTDIYVKGDKAYIGTKKGLTAIEVNSISKKETDIPVYFRSISLENENLLSVNSDTIQLAYKEPILDIRFAGISHKSKGRITYKYRLNATENWQYTNNNRLLLSNLASGDYILEIYASNGESSWSSKPAVLHILVAYPFWRTSLFQITAVLTLAFILLFIYRYALKRVKKREELKMQIQSLRFEALSAQMNPHFIFNSLNSIQNFIMSNDKKESILYLSKFAKLMRKTLNHSQAKNITLKEEIDALVLYLELESLRFDKLIRYELKIDPKINIDSVILPALLIQPVVENAILHGLRPKPQGGLILISFEEKNGYLDINVTDDGVGRAHSSVKQNQTQHDSKGGVLTEERIALFAKDFNADFKFEVTDLYLNNIPNGTSIHILIPLILSHKNEV